MSARLNNQVRLAAAKDDVLYFGEFSGSALWRLGSDGILRVVRLQSGRGLLHDAAADALGSVYFSLTDSGVVKVSADGTVQSITKKSPQSLAVGPLDQLYFSEYGGFTIQAPDGRSTSVDTKNLTGPIKSLATPYRMAVDSTGRVFINTDSNQIRVLTPAYASCPLSPVSSYMEVAAEGGQQDLEIEAADGCAWILEGTSSWITLGSSASGTGSGRVSIRVASNESSTPRTFVFTIAGKSITVHQVARDAPPMAAEDFLVIGASLQALSAPDAVIFLSAAGGLAVGEAIADRPSRSTLLAGTMVEVNGLPAVIDSAFPDRIVCFVPREVSLGPVRIVVKVHNNPVASGELTILPTAPAILLIGENDIGEVDGYNPHSLKSAPFPVETPENPGADKRTRVTFRVTGIRYADGRQPDGALVDVSSFLRVEATDHVGEPVSLQIEGTAFDAVFPGADLITVVLPQEANRTSTLTVRVFAGDVGSNPAVIRIEQVGQ